MPTVAEYVLGFNKVLLFSLQKGPRETLFIIGDSKLSFACRNLKLAIYFLTPQTPNSKFKMSVS